MQSLITVVPNENRGMGHTHHAAHKHMVVQDSLASKARDAVQFDSARLMSMPVSLVQKFAVDECGPVHIIIGDGGNIEGVCKPTASCLCLCHSKLLLKPEMCAVDACI